MSAHDTTIHHDDHAHGHEDDGGPHSTLSGYLIGWVSALVALPYGLGRAVWLWAGGRALKTIGQED